MEFKYSSGEKKSYHTKWVGRCIDMKKVSRKRPLKVLYSNVDSLLNKRNEMSATIDINKPDIICLVEILPKNRILPVLPCEFQLKDYNCFTNINSSSCHRDVLIYVKETFNSTIVNIDNSVLRESVWCEIFIDSDRLLVGGIYRSPNSTVENNLLVNELLVKMSKKYTNILIMGDFNHPDINWSDINSPLAKSKQSSEFIKSLHDSFLHQHVHTPTHYQPGNNATRIDLILTSELNMVSGLNQCVPLGKSHHNVITFDLQVRNSAQNLRNNSKFIYSRGDYSKMRKEIESVNWHAMKDLNVEFAWSFFHESIQNAITTNVPKVNKFIKKSIWMNSSTLSIIKQKRDAYRQYLLTKNEKDYLHYVKKRNQTKSACRKTVREFEKSLAKNVKNNPKAFYSYAKSKTKAKENIPVLIDDNNENATTDLSKAEMLNSFFASVFNDSALPSDPPVEFNVEHVRTSISDHIDLSPHIIREKLSKLNINKSAGPDDIHPRILCELANEIANPLSTLFHKVFDTGQLPQIWKEAVITPLFKKGKKSSPQNYRPISLTCVLVKVFESIIRDHIMSYLLSNELLSKSQHGFLPKRSCFTNLLTAIETWSDAIDRGINIDCIYLDFAKAFDKVPHKHLLTKLKAYGISGKIICWIESFLKDRKQQVIVNGVKSSSCNVTSGVPQGSVSGPLFFLVFINDLPDIIISLLLLFADDSKLFNFIKDQYSVQQLQNDLDKLDEWAKKWCIEFNITKCKVMHFGSSNNNSSYSMFDQTTNQHVIIDTTSCERDLGINVDNTLSFSKHTQIQVNKANRILGLIRRSFVHLDKVSFRLLFTTLVRPIIVYCGTICFPKLQRDKIDIENVLRRATKLIPGLCNLSYTNRLRTLNIPSMRYRLSRLDMIECYKILINYYVLDITPFQLVTGSKTRGHNFKIKKQRVLHERRKSFFTIRVVNSWNSLPSHIVNATSLNSFKNLLDIHWQDKMFDHFE